MNDQLRNVDNLHVLFIAAEADPLVKAGGLGDVAGSLPLAIQQLNHGKQFDVRGAIPFYNSIKKKNFPVEKVGTFEINTTDGLV